MVSETGLRVVRSNSWKGPNLSWKRTKKSQRAKRTFCGQQVLFGTKFMIFGPKRANLATLCWVRLGSSIWNVLWSWNNNERRLRLLEKNNWRKQLRSLPTDSRQVERSWKL